MFFSAGNGGSSGQERCLGIFIVRSTPIRSFGPDQVALSIGYGGAKKKLSKRPEKKAWPVVDHSTRVLVC
jgi:hypothetical protein